MSPGYADSRSPNLAIFAQLSDAPQAKKISAIKRDEKKKNTAKSLEPKSFGRFVGATRFSSLPSPVSVFVCLNLLTDICFVIFVHFAWAPQGGAVPGRALLTAVIAV